MRQRRDGAVHTGQDIPGRDPHPFHNQKAVGVCGIDAPHPLKTVAGNKFDPIYRWYIGLFGRYGWRLGADGESLVEDPAEQAAITMICQQRTDGKTLQAIADAVAEAHGIKLHTMQVKRIFDSRLKGENKA